MIVTFINWIWITVSFWLTGSLIKKIVSRYCNYSFKADEIFVAGIIFCTVYSEYFSLFYKVGLLCTLGLLFINIFALVICRHEIGILIKNCGKYREHSGLITACFFLACFFLMASTLKVEHVDSYLYHAQSIEWNELYGAVKGLGNIHKRFAYNSAFFCLQALFSWRSIIGRSLHVLNGLICLMASVYSASTFKYFKTKRFYVSDLMRLITFFYIIYTSEYISSPGSDIITLLIIIYIMIKWTDSLERVKKPDDHELFMMAFLGVTAVLDASLKLSVASAAVLCLYPFAIYIKKRKYSYVIITVVCGAIVILPFLIRNIIISGYLIYPFPGIDIFNVDWKMPADIVMADKIEITAWARALNNKGWHEWPLVKWVPEWWQYMDTKFKFFVLFDVITLLFSVPVLIKGAISRSLNIKHFFLACSIIMWLYWFFASPNVRYGMPYMIILPAALLLFADEAIIKNYGIFMTLIIGAMLFNLILNFDAYNCKIMYPEDYALNEGEENKVVSADGQEFIFYTPVNGSDIFEYPIYHQFPAVESKSWLKMFKMRGSDLSDGFAASFDSEGSAGK